MKALLRQNQRQWFGPTVWESSTNGAVITWTCNYARMTRDEDVVTAALLLTDANQDVNNYVIGDFSDDLESLGESLAAIAIETLRSRLPPSLFTGELADNQNWDPCAESRAYPR